MRLTGKFLACTGQRKGEEGQKRWTVRECPCGLCRAGGHVAVDERTDTGCYTAEELEEMPYLVWRHVAVGNLMPTSGPEMLRAEYFETPVIKLPLGRVWS